VLQHKPARCAHNRGPHCITTLATAPVHTARQTPAVHFVECSADAVGPACCLMTASCGMWCSATDVVQPLTVECCEVCVDDGVPHQLLLVAVKHSLRSTTGMSKSHQAKETRQPHYWSARRQTAMHSNRARLEILLPSALALKRALHTTS
jgi:hypothetical protein